MPAIVIQVEEVVPVPRRGKPWLSVQIGPPGPGEGSDVRQRRPFVRDYPPDYLAPYPGRFTRRPFPPWISRQAPVAPPTPALSGQAVYPVVAPVPDTEKDPGRLRRATQQLAAVFNSIAGKGFLREVGVSSWTLLPGGFYQNHPPGPNDDVTAGAYPFHPWIDTTTGIVYMNIDNTQGAAVWKRISV